MAQTLRRLWVTTAAAVLVVGLPARTEAQAQTTTHKQVVNFEVVSVNGNKVVVKGAGGSKEYTASDDQKFTVDGKEVTVQDLKPGMKGTATITTTTTVIPVHVTEVKKGEVMQASGNTLIVKTDQGIKMFSEADVAKRNVTIVKGGQPASLSDFHKGDILTATIVTQGTPRVLTQRQVDAALSGAPVPAASGAAASAASGATTGGTTSAATPRGTASAATTGGTASAAPARKLPKTASPLPLVGLTGLVFLALGVAITTLRRRAM